MAPKTKINLKERLENGELDLSMSDLQEVPIKEIAVVKKAQSLDLSNNRLASLGKTFVTLTQIIKLDLSNNLLQELPENFGVMKQLKHLDLYSNQITHLPLSFCELKNLRWLDLKNNPLVPAVAKVVGPCLDAQQCQQSARATVAFLTEMKDQVEEERERLRVQELKDLEAQQDKERQQRKRNERKKAAKARKKEINKKEVEKDFKETLPQKIEATNGTIIKEVEKPKKKKIPQKKSSLFKWFLILLFVPSLLLLSFLLSASNALGPKTDIYRTQVIDQWNQILQKLPPSAQDWGNYIGDRIEHIHTLTGYQIDNICVFITEVSESERAQDVKNRLVETWHVVYNQSGIIFRTFSEKISVASEELMKKLF